MEAFTKAGFPFRRKIRHLCESHRLLRISARAPMNTHLGFYWLGLAIRRYSDLVGGLNLSRICGKLLSSPVERVIWGKVLILRGI